MILTIKQAVEKGYTSCGYEDAEFASLMKISKLTGEEFETGKIVLAEIKPFYTPSIKPDTIAEMLAEFISSENGENTNDDTDNVYDTVNGLDFSATADMVNKALGGCKYYALTDIELIKDELSFSE